MKPLIIFLTAIFGCTIAIIVPPSASESRIHYGDAAQYDQFPFQCRILPNATSTTLSECTCTILSERHVLTTASCIRALVAPYNLRFAAISTTGGLTRTSTVLFEHPRFNANTYRYDAAILLLSQDLYLSEAVAPIRLPSISDVLETFLNKNFITYGWGPSNTPTAAVVLRWANMTVVPVRDCEIQTDLFVDGDNTICAIGDRQQSLCGADHGAPLFTMANSVPTLIGMAYAPRCQGSYATTFLRIAHLLGWINRVTGIRLRCLDTINLTLNAALH